MLAILELTTSPLTDLGLLSIINSFFKYFGTKNLKIYQKLRSQCFFINFYLFLAVSDNFVLSWKKKTNKFKILKNHCDLIFKFLVPKCSGNQIHLKNYSKSVMERGRGGIGNSKMADKWN